MLRRSRVKKRKKSKGHLLRGRQGHRTLLRLLNTRTPQILDLIRDIHARMTLVTGQYDVIRADIIETRQEIRDVRSDIGALRGSFQELTNLVHSLKQNPPSSSTQPPP